MPRIDGTVRSTQHEGHTVVDVSMPMRDGHTENGVKYSSYLCIVLESPTTTPAKFLVWNPGHPDAEEVMLGWDETYGKTVDSWGARCQVVFADDVPARVFNEIRPGKA